MTGQRFEKADAFRRKRVQLGMLNVENAKQLATALQRNINLGTRIFLADNIERNFPDIGRIKGLPGCSGMSADAAALANLESRAFQTEFAGPPCRNHELVGVIVFQEDCQAVVSKRRGNVPDDLIEKCFKIEDGVDLLRDALKQKQLLNSQELIEVVERSCGVGRVNHRPRLQGYYRFGSAQVGCRDARAGSRRSNPCLTPRSIPDLNLLMDRGRRQPFRGETSDRMHAAAMVTDRFTHHAAPSRPSARIRSSHPPRCSGRDSSRELLRRLPSRL
jgi:hypothetical protein